MTSVYLGTRIAVDPEYRYQFTHFWLQNPKKGGDIQFKFTKFPVRKSEETKQEDANLTTGVVK